MNELKNIKVGCAPCTIDGSKIFAVRPKNGCKGCIFDRKQEGARSCNMKQYCMSFRRPDKTSVIFVMK